MCFVLTVLVGYDNLFETMFVCLEKFNKLTAVPEFPLQCLFKLYSLPSLSRIVFYRGFYNSHDFSHMAPPRDCLR